MVINLNYINISNDSYARFKNYIRCCRECLVFDALKEKILFILFTLLRWFIMNAYCYCMVCRTKCSVLKQIVGLNFRYVLNKINLLAK